MQRARFVGVLFSTLFVPVGCMPRPSHSGLSPDAHSDSAPAPKKAGQAVVVPATHWLIPRPSKSAPPFASDACTELSRSLLGKMTLAEKVGQMTQPPRDRLAASGDIARFSLGSLLSGGGSGPAHNDPQAWRDMVDDYARLARGSRLAIPLIYGIDAVHGHNNVRGAVIFPHNVGLGCTRDPELVERIARATAEEVSATGIDWTFAPVVAAARDDRWGRTYEAYGETAELAETLGAAAIRGLQGPHLGQAHPSVLACAKHFVADGGTQLGRDRGNSLLDAQAMLDLHLRQYQAAIDAGVGSIMVSYSSVNGIKMHARRDLLTDVLKTQMGFRGFLVSDYGAVEQLVGDFATQVQTAVNAGVDMIMAPKTYQDFVATLVSLVPDRVPLSRIDDAVGRILTTKCELGLFRPERHRPPLSVVGSDGHRILAREAVARTLVMLKNDDGVLPLDPNTPKILVAGKNADDLGAQCGGWTIQWQGGLGPITAGTTIRRGIEMAVARGSRVVYSRDAEDSQGAGVAIVVVGEAPYAEYEGDRRDLRLDPKDVQVIDRAKASGAKVVLVIVSGRPLILGDVADKADAIVAAWLPGSEGEGVADVLFGRVKPTGKLSRTWPASMAQVPINVGDADYHPLYPFGAGLTYSPQRPRSDRDFDTALRRTVATLGLSTARW